MINAGAIVATGLVDGETSDDKLNRILEKFSIYTGRTLEVDADIYESEKTTGHRNRAIAHLLRNYDILQCDPENPLDAYFRQCSILVNARDLALMGATLANGGVNPITGIRAVDNNVVPNILSVMSTCGMYDYSGNWIHKVGMPAKSGVGGGIVAVLPGQLALAVFSPRLDDKGNSVRGIAVCEDMSSEFGLHMHRVTRTTTASIIRVGYPATRIRSKLERDIDTLATLDEYGDRIYIFELSGELMFVSTEIVVTRCIAEAEGRSFIIIDLTRVTSIDVSASILLSDMVRSLSDEGIQIMFTGIERHYHFGRSIERACSECSLTPISRYIDVDHALEYAEDCLLNNNRTSDNEVEEVPLQNQPLCRNITEKELALLMKLLVEESFGADEVICREDEPADKLYFLLSGRVNASVKLDHIRRHRLATTVAGAAFGETSLFQKGKRTADIIAESAVRTLSFSPDRLRQSDELLAKKLLNRLLSNLAKINTERLDRANEEIRILTQ
jgi:glutaminase